MRLKSIVAHYKRQVRVRAREELDWFREQPDLDTAVMTAAKALKRNGKRFRHQCRVKRKAMAGALKALSAGAEGLQGAGSFDALIGKVHALVGSIPGIGDLYVYDTALRLGAFLGSAPTRIYLHAGTRTGARRLGLQTRGRAHLEVAEVLALAPEFSELSAGEIEDVLCIYKDALRDRKAGTAAFVPPGESWCS